MSSDASRAAPSRATRRSTALTRPAKCNACRSARTRRTERSTAAWSGTLRNRICAAPMSSAVSTRGACGGGPRSSNSPSRWRNVPSRRSTAPTSARTSARSRSSSAANSPVVSSNSSSGRRRRMTPSTMSAAMRRTARPGTSSVWPERAFGLSESLHCEKSSLRLEMGPLRQVRCDANRPAKVCRERCGENQPAGKRPLTPAAERALAEAVARRAEREREKASQPKEAGGRDGPEPTRYGDWEINGLTSDF